MKRKRIQHRTNRKGGSCRTLLDDVEDDVVVDDEEVEDFDVVDVWLSRIIVQSMCSFLYRPREFVPELVERLRA
jgi:hypothetical protein